MEISKELFENVMGIKLGNAHNTEQELLVTNQVAMFTDIKKTYKLGHPIDTINIYELAHKCKEWAFNNGYELRNGRDIDVKEELCYFCEYKQERQLDYANSDYFLAETEPESIFKACQWILDRKIKG